MKKFILCLPLFLFASEVTMPPMPPMPPNIKLTKKNKPQKKEKNVLPKECRIIPPMIIFLPPPLEVDLRKCKNRLFMPQVKDVEKKLKVKVKKIEIVDGFSELYKIVTNKKVLFCNKDLTKCFEVKKWIKK